MKSIFGIALLWMLTVVPFAWASELRIVHTDPEWKDGKGDVPDKGICIKRGGKGFSPAITVSGIPDTAVTLRLMFTDDDYGNEGGHGDFILKLNGQGIIKIPSIGGNDNFLPSNMIGGNGHHCWDCPEIDYLGPCSGGRGNRYRVNIYARDSEQKLLTKGTLLLGHY